MATTLPPPRKPKVTEADIEAVINKGGSTIKETAPGDPKRQSTLMCALLAKLLVRLIVAG